MLYQTSNMYQVQELHTYLFLVPWISKILQDALHLNLLKLCNQSKINYEVDSLFLHKKIWTYVHGSYITASQNYEPENHFQQFCCLEEQLLLWSLSGHEFVRVFQSADIAIVTTSWYWLQCTKWWRFCVHWWKLPSAPIKLTTLYKIAYGRKLSEVNPEHLSNPCSTVGLAANVNWPCILAIQTWSQMPCMQYCASSYLWGFRENST